MPSERHPALVALGAQTRKIRRERGVSQEDFAYRAEIARSYYGGVERGEWNLSALNLMRIAQAVEVEVGEFFPRSLVIDGPLGNQDGEGICR